MKDYLVHYGTLGQKWGIRKYQNPDGSLTELGRQRYLKKDTKWAKKNYDKIYKNTYKKSRPELLKAVDELNKRTDIQKYNANHKLSLQYVNEYNRKLAEIMTKNASDLRSPYLDYSIKYIAKRGEVGAHMILSEQEFNTQLLKNGVYGDGRIAYKKNQVNMA